MDSSIFIKPRAGAQKPYAPRDPVPVHETTETELHATKSVSAPGDGGGHPGEQHRQQGQGHGQAEQRDRAAHEVVVDPQSREVIYRERDVRLADREHPDQALLRQRAYRQPITGGDAPLSSEPHADIEA